MTITYDDESPAPAAKPKIVYEERRKPAGGYANALALQDTGTALASGMLAAPLSGFAGIGGALLPGPPGQGADWAGRVGNALTYEPRTEAGQGAMKVISIPFDLLHKAGVWAGEKAQDAGAPPSVATAIQTAAEVGPTLAATQIPKSLAPAMEARAKILYQKALKPSRNEMLSGKGESAIMTMLEDGTLPTKGGLEKMRSEIDALNDQIADAIKNSNLNVNKLEVAKVMRDKLEEVKKQATPQGDIASLRKSWMEFVDHPLLQNSHLIPIQLAQEIKQGTYKALGNKAYGELKSADIEGQKTIARGLKEAIAAKAPEVAPLNARESVLINASDILANRLATAGNRNPIGFGTMAPSGPGLVAWLLDRGELPKGILAQILYGASKPGIPSPLPEFMLGSMQEEQAQRARK